MLTPHSFLISTGIRPRVIAARALGGARAKTHMNKTAGGTMTGAGIGVAVN